MLKTTLMLTLLILAASSSGAMACSLSIDPPSTRFADAHSVVLAVPLGNSIKPERVDGSSQTRNVRQTIQWWVLVAWKGQFKIGDKLTTRQSLQIAPGKCQFLVEFQGQEPNLLYLFDREPFAQFMALPPDLAIDDLRYLEEQAATRVDGT